MIEDKEMSTKNRSQEDKLDMLARLKTVWIGRRKIIKITIVFACIGMFVAVFSEKEYTASTTIVPQTNTGKSLGGNFGGLAAIAGIDLGGSSANDSGISPLLYPHITNSIPFQKELLATPLTVFGYDKPVTFQEYYTNIYQPGLLGIIKKYTIGLPSLIISAIKGKPAKTYLKLIKSDSQIIQITFDEKTLIERLKKQVVLTVNEKEGYISFSSTMPDGINAAELTQSAQVLLQKYVIDFKVKKSKNQLVFIKERYAEKEKKYKETQNKLASYQDKNQFLNSALAKNTQVIYQAEYDLAFNVFSELAKQLETQQIKVKEDTPIFTILEPVSFPLEKSHPKKLKILLIFTFLGFILGASMVFSKPFIKQFITKLKED